VSAEKSLRIISHSFKIKQLVLVIANCWSTSAKHWKFQIPKFQIPKNPKSKFQNPKLLEIEMQNLFGFGAWYWRFHCFALVLR